MNFFQHQEAARKKTGRLVLLFALAVTAIIGAVYLVVAFAYTAAHAPPGHTLQGVELWNPNLFGVTATGVGLLIAAGSLCRIAALGTGGKAVAEMLGGRLLSSSTTDLHERRLLNVVEEMALAAGMPVPAVYVLDRETAINAFAAGFSPADAVIGVTRGTIDVLNRDELQGVIAHEFSHILNGDMRLNIRLMGVLYGILLISLIGYFMFRIALQIRPSSGSSDSKKDGGAAAFMLALLGVGAALYVLGYLGVFFGNLIKSAVSRQREYLADASAVQFTRNPPGIGGALRKIGALGSRLATPQAAQASHMFFGNGVKASWLGLTATHPPLVERIRRIDPTFDGDFSQEKLPPVDAPGEVVEVVAPRMRSRPGLFPIAGTAAVAGLSPQQAVADVGSPQPAHLEFAASLLDDLPPELVREVHDPLGAACLVYAALLQADPADDEPLLAQMQRETAERVRRDLELVRPLPAEARLPLAQLAMTALRQLTPGQYDQFRKIVVALIRADRRVSLFEFGVHRLILKHLAQHFEPQSPATTTYRAVAEVVPQATVLLSALAHAGHPGDVVEAQKSYGAGRTALGNDLPAAPLGRDACGFGPLDASLNDLARAAAPLKQAILQACAACIGRDGTMTVDEGELLRTVADSLDCPMPPPTALARR
jgi:Zn-dependent protease with chaperone function